jgi:hypothetical protein
MADDSLSHKVVRPIVTLRDDVHQIEHGVSDFSLLFLLDKVHTIL